MYTVTTTVYISVQHTHATAAYDDGRTELLLCIHGLLPISYRGASYHIPIALWIPRDHPRTPPIAYVVPTNDMLVRTSPHLEHSGRCSIGYQDDWQRKPEVRRSFLVAGVLE